MKRILIIEDEKDMQELYRDMFSNQDKYEIDIEGGAMSALKLLEKNKYDLIILDIIMDPIAGDSFFVYLRSDIKTEKIPVLIVSVIGDTSDLRESLKKINGAQFLKKPVTREQLLGRIDDMLGRTK